ncbi:hypothetical protein C922_05703 [Plasmodium inui San Antonio 1]|uniref:Uncharacterized protein n=1 Tax=Plasmodium inui San Antonio 1 TaxID=1237626 RepID=W6ZX89_9APIC|nr:hypothetical protein C922_05703 [Plasmodium inui San Antonio 1]EUD63918.1 hypothetical protein C922_05703 [Plasmodium inui San Antonio 1]
MNSVNNNLFRMAVLERRINLDQDAKKGMHTLKDYLSYYLGRLTGVSQEAVVLVVIMDHLPQLKPNPFINLAKQAFTIFINKSLSKEGSELNKCVLKSGHLIVESDG